MQSIIYFQTEALNACLLISRYFTYSTERLKSLYQSYAENNEPKPFFNASLMKAHFGFPCGSPVYDVTEDTVHSDDVANERAWPWHVNLIINQPVSPHVHCSGALISKSWVLTVATCLQSSVSARENVTVILGPWSYVATGQANLHVQMRKPAKILVHEKFDDFASLNNVALIKLDQDVMTDNYVQPVCLPNLSQVFDDDRHCYVTGWNLTRARSRRTSLQQARARIVPQGVCAYSARLDDKFLDGCKMCVDVDDLQDDACARVVGAPLSCRLDGTYFLFGIMEQYSSARLSRFLPTVETRVTEYIDWIVTKVASDD